MKDYKLNENNVCINPDNHKITMGKSFISVQTAFLKGKWFNGHEYHIFSGCITNLEYDGGACPCMYSLSPKIKSFQTQQDAIVDGFAYYKNRHPELSKKIDKYLTTLFGPKQLSLF